MSIQFYLDYLCLISNKLLVSIKWKIFFRKTFKLSMSQDSAKLKNVTLSVVTRNKWVHPLDIM